MNTFEIFNNGKLFINGTISDIVNLKWTKHPTFEGVALKHIITSNDTDGAFSYHLVRIAPGKSIGCHVHNTQLETHEVIAGSGKCTLSDSEIGYTPGTVVVIKKNVPHRVDAAKCGLYLFAKFMPALG